MLVVGALAAYVGIGAVVALAFVLRGVGRAPGPLASVTAGGRAMLFPGALVLWPVVVRRWASGR